MVVGRSPCANEAGRDLQTFGHYKFAACSEARRWGSASLCCEAVSRRSGGVDGGAHDEARPLEPHRQGRHLQVAAEAYLVGLFQDAQLCAVHACRRTSSLLAASAVSGRRLICFMRGLPIVYDCHSLLRVALLVCWIGTEKKVGKIAQEKKKERRGRLPHPPLSPPPYGGTKSKRASVE